METKSRKIYKWLAILPEDQIKEMTAKVLSHNRLYSLA